MITRSIRTTIETALSRMPAVAVLGPRQVGKTTLSYEIAEAMGGVYLDLEMRADREKLNDPVSYLRNYADRLVVLDEIHRMPEIFQELRGLIDEGRREGNRTARFLILGSAAIELLQQSETLAGRIEYVNLTPFHALEVTRPETLTQDLNKLWLRGGFPDSYLAQNDADSFTIRQNFIRTYLERDVPLFGPRMPSTTMERLWTMLAHCQGTLLNASKLASSLEVSAPSISTYIDLLVDLLLVRRLQPYHININKRLVKSPKTYIRDSGILHALLKIHDLDELLGHPINGPSWEGFVIENILNVAPSWVTPSFYRTLAGAEIDLILEIGGSTGIWAIEIKRGLAPKLERGFHVACEDLAPNKVFLIYSGKERYPREGGVEVIHLYEFLQEVANL